MIKVSIHQPMYLPYPGVFSKIKNVDVFVFLDDAQYSKRYYYNRNRIKTPNGELMLTVPIKKFSSEQKFNEIQIDNSTQWGRRHMKILSANYNKSKYFNSYKEFFEEVYGAKWEKLHDLNMKTIIYLMEQLDITTPFYFSSEILKNKEVRGTERNMKICRELNADVYLSGVSGKDYLDLKIFEEAGIKVEFQNYIQKEYRQQFGGYINNLSIIDMLFNLGSEAKSYL